MMVLEDCFRGPGLKMQEGQQGWKTCSREKFQRAFGLKQRRVCMSGASSIRGTFRIIQIAQDLNRIVCEGENSRNTLVETEVPLLGGASLSALRLMAAPLQACLSASSAAKAPQTWGQTHSVCSVCGGGGQPWCHVIFKKSGPYAKTP